MGSGAATRSCRLPFDVTDLSGKAAAKRALLEAYGLPVDAEQLASPVVGMVSRMVDQKGLDLIAALAGELPRRWRPSSCSAPATPAIRTCGRRWPRGGPIASRSHVGYDERRAHLIEGGADIFLMPSRFEPCGLNQMYSLRYGTVPVVRAVGGLVDTVRPYNPRNGQGTGFLFSEYSPRGARRSAAATRWRSTAAIPTAWTRLQKNGMRKDFSWDRSAAEYVKVYKRVLASRRDAPPGPRHLMCRGRYGF